MKRMLYRMVLEDFETGYQLLEGVYIQSYHPERHHEAIRYVYARAFSQPAWPPDWDQFPEFDPQGAFVAERTSNGDVIGYVLSFHRGDHGYISVVAVLPEYQRRERLCAYKDTNRLPVRTRFLECY